jgi:hypothetical protein
MWRKKEIEGRSQGEQTEIQEWRGVGGGKRVEGKKKRGRGYKGLHIWRACFLKRDLKGRLGSLNKLKKL